MMIKTSLIIEASLKSRGGSNKTSVVVMEN